MFYLSPLSRLIDKGFYISLALMVSLTIAGCGLNISGSQKGGKGPTGTGGRTPSSSPSSPPNRDDSDTDGENEGDINGSFASAIKSNDSDKVEAMCKKDPGLGQKLIDGKTPLRVAIEARYLLIASQILKHCNNDLDHQDSHGRNALLFLLAGYHQSMDNFLRLLISRMLPGSLAAMDKDGYSALSYTLSHHRGSLSKAIVEHNDDLALHQMKFTDGSRMTPLEFVNKYLSKFDSAFTIYLSGLVSVLKKEQDSHIAFTPTEDFQITDDYISVTEASEGGSLSFEIKKGVSTAIFIKRKGKGIIDSIEVDEIERSDFIDVAYLLLPTSHWFYQHFINNPFAGTGIALVRPSIWGYELKLEREDKGSALFRVLGNILKKPVLESITDQKLESHFGAQSTWTELGKGGQGIVYKFSYQGQDYAIKKNGQEYRVLEELQWTRAVVLTYGAFELHSDDKTYMIMELGTASLHDKNQAKVKIPLDDLIDAAKRFIYLLQAQRALGITNKDVKPRNIILDQNGALKVIDPSAGDKGIATKGFSGSDSQLLAQSLLENHLGIEIRGGHVSLDRFHQFDDKWYRDHFILSPDGFKYWSRMVCEKEEVKDPSKPCNELSSYEELFPLFSPEQLLEYGSKIDIRYKDQSGTTDSVQYGPYKTGLPLPQHRDESQVNWQAFYQKRDEIGPRFCQLIKQDYGYGGNFYFAEKKYKHYRKLCKKNQSKFVQEFTVGPDDKKFHQWIMDAYYPQVKYNTFLALAPKYSYERVLPYIISSHAKMKTNNVKEQKFYELLQKLANL